MSADAGDKLAVLGLLLWGLLSMGLWTVRTVTGAVRRWMSAADR